MFSSGGTVSHSCLSEMGKAKKKCAEKKSLSVKHDHACGEEKLRMRKRKFKWMKAVQQNEEREEKKN